MPEPLIYRLYTPCPASIRLDAVAAPAAAGPAGNSVRRDRKPLRIGGMAMRYGELTADGAGRGERLVFEPGALAESLRSTDQRMLAHHDTSSPLARVSAGNLRYRDTGQALFLSAELPDTSIGWHLYTLLTTGVLDGLSIGIRVHDRQKDMSVDRKPEIPVITIRRAELFETSLVSWPALVSAKAWVDSGAVPGMSEIRQRVALQVAIAADGWKHRASDLRRRLCKVRLRACSR